MKVRIEKIEVEIDERLIQQIAQAIVMVDASQEQTRSQADDSHRTYLMTLLATFVPLLKDILNPPKPPAPEPGPMGVPPFRPRAARPPRPATPYDVDKALRDLVERHPDAAQPEAAYMPPDDAAAPPPDDEPWRDGGNNPD